MPFVCPECARAYPAPGFCTEDGGQLNDNAACPLLGTTIGSYRVATLIGQGGMGEVYRGVHPEIGSRVAIKVLSSDAARSPAVAERFFAEARAVNVIRHEGIVSVLDLARLPDGRPYIVMEYLEGAPLTRVLAEHRPVPEGALLQLLSSVLDALGAAHAHGITHRDLKPDNVFVTSIGRTKILDFGIAKLRPEISGIDAATRTGALLGTPYYMSPEQARGQPVDHRSDIYSLGVIAFEGFTGRRPFDADNLFDLLRQQIEVAPPRPCALRPELPPALESVVLRALEKDPARRYQSAAELAEALRQTAPFLPPSSFVTLTGQPSSLPRPVLQGAAPAPTPPTAPGLSATIPTEQRTRSGRFGLPLLIGVVALGLGAVALATTALSLILFRDRSSVPIATPSVSKARRQSKSAQQNEPGTGVTSLRRVEAVSFYPQARKMARDKLPGAKLSTMSVTNPQSDGTVDFNKEDAGTISYTFSTKDGMVSVTLDGENPIVAVPPIAMPMTGTVRPPRCSIGKVLKAAGLGSVDMASYGPAASWTVVSDEDVRLVPDNC